MLALAAHFDLDARQLDGVNAFLNSHLRPEIRVKRRRHTNPEHEQNELLCSHYRPRQSSGPGITVQEMIQVPLDGRPQLVERSFKISSMRSDLRDILASRSPRRMLCWQDGLTRRIGAEYPSAAAIIQALGDVQAVPCTACQTKSSPFVECATLPGVLKGVCANCYWDKNGSHCSHSKCFTMHNCYWH